MLSSAAEQLPSPQSIAAALTVPAALKASTPTTCYTSPAKARVACVAHSRPPLSGSAHSGEDGNQSDPVTSVGAKGHVEQRSATVQRKRGQQDCGRGRQQHKPGPRSWEAERGRSCGSV
jgi:hypothetical protein